MPLLRHVLFGMPPNPSVVYWRLVKVVKTVVVGLALEVLLAMQASAALVQYAFHKLSMATTVDASIGILWYFI